MRALVARLLRSGAVCLLPLLAGCGGRYVFEDFRGGYQSAEMPTAFATGNEAMLVSGNISWTRQAPIAFKRSDTLWSDTLWNRVWFDRDEGSGSLVPYPIEGRYRIERGPVLVSGSFIFQIEPAFIGAFAGISAPRPEYFQAGGFLGFSKFFFGNRLAPMASLGLALNRVSAGGRYWKEENSAFPLGAGYTPDPSRDTSETHPLVWSMPVKLGLLLRVHDAFQPYTCIQGVETQLWPAENSEPGRYRVDDGGITIGFRNASLPGWLLSLEWTWLSVGGPMNYEGEASKASLALQRVFQ